jgi:ABC-type glycerol-3-phosphate transport system substrate-binding protein
MPRLPRSSALLLAGLLVLSACGGEDAPDDVATTEADDVAESTDVDEASDEESTEVTGSGTGDVETDD